MGRNTICIFNLLTILKNSNPPLMWTELFGSKAFKDKSELNKALSTCINSGLVQKRNSVDGHHLFSITPKGITFLETFAPKWKMRGMRRIRRRPVLF